ncbi:hypothetical protein [Nocardia sp. NPDC004860]|uniref:hypothetical protein n=1 Tax=Nocardia sp. NPDC004860 TaxID=3154557 RepID=UPI0033BB58AD
MAQTTPGRIRLISDKDSDRSLQDLQQFNAELLVDAALLTRGDGEIRSVDDDFGQVEQAAKDPSISPNGQRRCAGPSLRTTPPG